MKVFKINKENNIWQNKTKMLSWIIFIWKNLQYFILCVAKVSEPQGWAINLKKEIRDGRFHSVQWGG